MYDRANDGNGTAETINKWFHVPSVVREIARDNPGIVPTLLTRDFIDTLMMFLRPCHAHQSERTAHLSTIKGAFISREELPKRYREDFDFCIEQYPERWNSFNQKEFYSLKEADLLAEMTTLEDVEAEEIKKAARVCSTACPQCLEEFGINAVGPLIGLFMPTSDFLILVSNKQYRIYLIYIVRFLLVLKGLSMDLLKWVTWN